VRRDPCGLQPGVPCFDIQVHRHIDRQFLKADIVNLSKLIQPQTLAHTIRQVLAQGATKEA
jgi:hypothetical protein